MKPTFSEIFAALGPVDAEVVTLLESLVRRGILPEANERAAEELLGHARSIADRLASFHPLVEDERYTAGEFVLALRAEIAMKKQKTPYCPPTLAAFESFLAQQGIEAAAA
jgi:hypothetical protein